MIELTGYQILDRIYSGTRTLVYRGTRICDETPVVIKVLRSEYPSFSELVQFRNQYTIAKNLNLPGIIQTYSLEAYQNGYALIVEDFGGISLKEWTEEGETVPSLVEFLLIAIDMSTTLDVLCRDRIIHKDIKPANILINPTTKQIKLIDFSIASLLPRETQTLMNPNVLEGTLNYLSPEQTGRMNRGIDYRTDFYSLGVTFYELLTGQLPFSSSDPMELIHCHIAKQPPSVHQINPEIPVVLSSIVSKLMAKNAENRYQSALGLKADLENCLQQLNETGKIESFVIGQRDLCDRFIIPEKLYGRATEVATLLAAFDRVAGKEKANISRSQALPGNEYQEALPPLSVPIPPRSQAVPGNEDPEALPPLSVPILSQLNREAEPLEMRSQAEPGNKGKSRSEMMLVAGFSGIGKTVVVNEVHKPIVRQRGYFIKGKYDQFQRNIPFSAFVQAFRDLMGQLLSESDAQLQTWKAKILEVVGDNGQVLIDVIPELERIIGTQPPATELSGSAAQNRFNLLMQKFVQIFTSVEHPLVMFLDDLQWADSASLKLLQLLMAETGHLLILGAYRDNEVSPAHPFMLTVDEIMKTGAVVNTITLQPLSLVDLNQLVADTLNCQLLLAQPLTELVSQKTKGNPFFATQFLKALHDDEQITFDSETRYWQCDIGQVKALALTDDVVEFMAVQLQKLPTQTQDVLKLAACIGAQFDLQTLAIVSEQSPEDAATALWKGLQEGLMIPNTEIYKFFTQSDTITVTNAIWSLSEVEVHTSTSLSDQNYPNHLNNRDKFVSQVLANPTYRFLHDRVQQAAYSLIPDDQKQTTHLKIGQLIQQKCSEIEQEEKLFDILGHLNLGKSLIDRQQEWESLAKLNLKAGRKARNSTAYVAATIYIQTGLKLLADNSWKNQYELTLDLYVAATETAYLNADLARMEQMAQFVLQNAQTILDKVKIYEIQIKSLTAQCHMLEAIAVGRDVLKQLGIELPTEPDEAFIGKGLQALAKQLQGRQIEELADLPVMSDRQTQAAMQLLPILFSPIIAGMPGLLPILGFTMVSLSLQFGNAPASTIGYVTHGMVMCAFLRETKQGYNFGKLAINLLDRSNIPEVKSQVIGMFGAFIQHHQELLSATVATLKAGYVAGIETGDFLSAGYSSSSYIYATFFCGQELSSVESEMINFSVVLGQINQYSAQGYVDITRQMLQNLMETMSQPDALIGVAYDEIVMVPKHHQNKDLFPLAIVYIYKMLLAYVFGNYPAALDHMIQSKEYLISLSGTVIFPIFHFYAALAQLAIFLTESETKQAEILLVVETHQTTLHQWAKNAPMNYLHKWHLIEAEKCRVLGKKAEAIENYDRTIQLAKQNEYIQEEALANELAAKFYLDWGKEKVAQSYMIDAYYAYSRWGAKAKVQDLETRYGQLLTPILQKPVALLTASESISSSLKTLVSVHHTVSTSSSTSTISQMLDMATVLKAAQSLYGAIELDELLSSLMQVVMENAGADKAVLILNKDGNLEIAAQCLVNISCNLQALSIENCQDLPVNVIYYVKRTQETLLSTDDSTIFASDSYLMQQHPQSFLCTPIINQGKLIGILYLENSVTAGAFTADRIELLKLLCSQAAISLENARLYQKSQQALENLQQAQLQLIQSEKMSALGNLVAGVAHEINNPVGFLKGNLKPAMDGIQDLFGLIDIYQQEYPDQTTAIQDEIEAIDLDFLRADLPNLVGSMAEGIDRICNISVSLRTFSRADSDRPLPFNIHEGIDSTILILKHRLKASESRPSIEILKDYGNLPAIECYAGQLNQVFMNFLANAIDALEDSNSGRSYQEIEANPNQIIIQTAVSEDKKSVIIRIKDNGIGMSESVQEQIFEHLFTTKAVGKGTGLGLAIARQIVVEKHQGAIEVNSVLGSGTEFVISLPAKALTSS